MVGLALLLGGGTAMVKGASGLATSIGVPPLVVGLTVVAFGTSAPELVVNLAGVLRGETALAFGNMGGRTRSDMFQHVDRQGGHAASNRACARSRP